MPKPTEKKTKDDEALKGRGKSGLPHGKKKDTVAKTKLSRAELELVVDALGMAAVIDPTLTDAMEALRAKVEGLLAEEVSEVDDDTDVV